MIKKEAIEFARVGHPSMALFAYPLGLYDGAGFRPPVPTIG